MYDKAARYGCSAYRFAPTLTTLLPDRSLCILDVGAGDGGLCKKLKQAGYSNLHVMDIAENAPCFKLDVPGYVHWAWDAPYPVTPDWILCMDVMEHIPEGMVDRTLEVQYDTAKIGAVYNIAFVPDCSGHKVIGEELHITIRPEAWWYAKLTALWSRVEVLPPKWGDGAETWVCYK